MQIYVSKNGQRYGPYSLLELRGELLANVFRPEHFASSDNGRTWEPISAIPGIGPLVYAVEVETANNLLVIHYRGYVRPSAVEACARDVESALKRLSPGFGILVDFSELESMEVDCAPPLKRIMQLCNDKGASAVVRVIPDPQRDIGLSIMSYFHYGPQVQIQTCQTLEEAREILGRCIEHPPGAAPISVPASGK